MSNINFPTKPSSDIDWQDPKAAADYQAAMAAYQMALNVISHSMNMEQEGASTREKNKHDALMSIVRNMKANG